MRKGILDGTRAGVVESNNLGDQTAITWTYDNLGRLIGEDYDRGNDGPSAEDYETTYVYNLVGNRLSKSTDTYDDGNLDGADVEVSYDYDANDRLLSETKDDLLDDANDRHTVYSYDADGDGVSDDTVKTGKTVHQGLNPAGTVVSETTYQYDARGRLAKLTIDSNGDNVTDSTIEYAYNDDGIRVSMTTGGQTVRYLIDANNSTSYAQAIEERDAAGNVTKTYTIGLDVIAQAAVQALSADGINIAAEELLALLYDGHGSTRALLDDAAQVVQRFAYDAYGNQLSGVGLAGSSAAFTTLLYSGEHFDAKAQMQYLRARWYNPASGRFNRLDPYAGNMHDPQSLHKYLYASGNPVMGIDPTGLFTVAEVATTVGNMLNLASKALRVVSAVQRTTSFLQTVNDIRSLLLEGGLSTIIRQVRDHVAQWTITPGSQTAALVDAEFWQSAATVLAQQAPRLLFYTFWRHQDTIIAKYAQKNQDPFKWLIYAPTPIERNLNVGLPTPVPIPGLKFGGVSAALKFGGGGKKMRHTGRLFGIGIYDINSRNDQQFFRMDYHPGHSRSHRDAWYREVSSGNFDFHFHVLK